VATLFAGIDVLKDTLAVALSSGREWSCANDARRIMLRRGRGKIPASNATQSRGFEPEAF
jgi:hypothetical protein